MGFPICSISLVRTHRHSSAPRQLFVSEEPIINKSTILSFDFSDFRDRVQREKLTCEQQLRTSTISSTHLDYLHAIQSEPQTSFFSPSSGKEALERYHLIDRAMTWNTERTAGHFFPHFFAKIHWKVLMNFVFRCDPSLTLGCSVMSIKTNS